MCVCVGVGMQTTLYKFVKKEKQNAKININVRKKIPQKLGGKGRLLTSR